METLLDMWCFNIDFLSDDEMIKIENKVISGENLDEQDFINIVFERKGHRKGHS